MKRLLLFFAATVLFMPATASAQAAPSCAGHLVSVRPDGAVSAGSKDALRQAVEAGQPIRVGYSMDFENDGTVDLVHWADALFLTIFENEVFTQMPQIHRQSPVRGKAEIKLAAGPGYWNASLGTNGVLEGRWNFDEVRSFKVASTWCVDPRALGQGGKRK
ncbi:MAG TPA: hypothetical protein VED40_04560 [Azospirillaceae bacterium]|nr:hypothetical protein [Azospirillaceae bacterium]